MQHTGKFLFLLCLARGPLNRGALGHGLVGLCLNPALYTPTLRLSDVPTASYWDVPLYSFSVDSFANLNLFARGIVSVNLTNSE